jgi:hypothetical protein
MYSVCTRTITCVWHKLRHLFSVGPPQHACHTVSFSPVKWHKEHPQKYVFSKHGTYQYVRVFTWYILVCTSWTTCTFSREWESILMLGYYHILVPHTQYHFSRSKVKEMSLHTLSGKFGLDQYIQVFTSDRQVHTNTDHTHTSFSIRMYMDVPFRKEIKL